MSHLESDGWQSAHYQAPFHQLRVARIPGKLRRLGVLDLHPDTRILDTCCGGGEALQALARFGFRQLDGVDASPHLVWRQTPNCRFVASDVRQLPFLAQQFGAVTNLHALHHLGGPDGVEQFLIECERVLKPGGRLYILDFPGSAQIRYLFRLLRKRIGVWTPGLRNFAEIVDEEWPYLPAYLGRWRRTRQVLLQGPLRLVHWRQEFFLYYLTLEKRSG